MIAYSILCLAQRTVHVSLPLSGSHFVSSLKDDSLKSNEIEAITRQRTARAVEKRLMNKVNRFRESRARERTNAIFLYWVKDYARDVVSIINDREAVRISSPCAHATALRFRSRAFKRKKANERKPLLQRLHFEILRNGSCWCRTLRDQRPTNYNRFDCSMQFIAVCDFHFSQAIIRPARTVLIDDTRVRLSTQ